MLSRIQSLYLLIAALLAFFSMAYPFWVFTTNTVVLFGDFNSMESAGVIVSVSSIAGGILSLLTGIVALITMFLFSKRKLQQTLISLCVVLFVADLLAGLAGGHFLKQYLEMQSTSVSFVPGSGLFILLPEPILFWLASLGVKKDEKIATAYKRL